MRKPLFKIRQNGSFGFIDSDGEIVIEPQFFDVAEFRNGFSKALFNDKWALLDSVGRLFIKRLYHFIGTAEEDFVRVQLVFRWGFLDKKGSEAVPCQFEEASDFREGLAAVRFRGSVGYLKKDDFSFSIRPQFERGGAFSNGLAPVFLKTGKAAAIDRDGRRVFELDCDDLRAFQKDVAVFVDEEKWGLVSRSGEQLLKPQFEFVRGRTSGEFFEGMALAFRGGKWGFVNEAGEVAVEPKYDDAGDFGEGLALVKTENAFGFIEKSGKMAISPRFEDAGVFFDGLAPVRENGRWGFIDTDGKWAIEPIFDRAEPFRDRLARVEKGEKWAYVNRFGDSIWEEK